MKKALLVVTLVGALAGSSLAFAAAMPSVRFVTPKANATTGSTVTFTVKLANFRLDPQDVGKMKMAHMGHLHFSLDGGKYDYPRYSGANGALAVKLGTAGKYSPSVSPSITYKHLPKGRHKIVVYLANNDHSPVGPKATEWFTVR